MNGRPELDMGDSVEHDPVLVTGIFINYRSADGRIAAETIFRDLAANFGPENVFLDKQVILPGVAYPGKIRSWIHEHCSVMIAVIGHWVHDEIADALTVTRQGMRIRHFDEYDDMRNLIRCIEALDPGLAADRRTPKQPDSPAWAARTSDFIYRSAAQVYSIAYKPEIGASLIRLTQALGGFTAGAASILQHIPHRKAAATLEAMDRRNALLILREMEPANRRLILDHLPADIRYAMAADDYTGSG